MQKYIILEMGRSEHGEKENKHQPEPQIIWVTEEEGEEFHWQSLRRKNENYSKTLKEGLILSSLWKFKGLISLWSYSG